MLTLDLNNLPEKSNSSTSTTSVNGAEETNGELVSNTPGMSPKMLVGHQISVGRLTVTELTFFRKEGYPSKEQLS